MVALLIAASVIAGQVAQSAAMGWVAFAALAVSAWRLWIPVRFEFASKGITQTVLGRRRRIPWTEFARIEVRRQGVLLLTEPEPSTLATFRGLYVRWRNQREALLESLGFFIASRSEPQPATTRTYQRD